MTVDRLLRVNELLRREIGEAMPEVAEAERFDKASVTVTGVSADRDLKHARVSVSVMGDEADHEEIVARINRHRKDIQARIGKRIKMKFTPRLTFRLDKSMRKGLRVLDIMAQLETNEAPEA